MAFERKLAAVPPQAFTSDGTSVGVITIPSTAGYYIKQGVILKSNTLQSAGFQVKNVLSPTQLILGPQDNSLNAPLKPTDLSGYIVADAATIFAVEQNNFPIKPDDHYLSVYTPAPVSADRVIDVDPFGNPYGPNNPFPVSFDGTISIGEVTVVGTAPSHFPLEPNPDGSINVIVESTPSPNTAIVNTYNEMLLVASGATVNIVTYTVPVSKQAVFQKAAFSGENIARYDLFINGIVQDTARTMFGGDLTGEFSFTTGNDSGLILTTGNTISVQVFNVRPTTANFEARIQVLEIPV